jgi:YjbE family integral membrane protein
MLVGGLLLVWIAYKLLAEKKDHANIAVYGNLAAAVRTIIIADGVMGIDNVLGVAGAAQGSVVLIIFGFIISVPIIIWGSALFIKTVDRYPVIIYIGGAVLAWTAGKMITEDPLVHTYFASFPVLKWLVIGATIIGVMVASLIKRPAKNRQSHP